MTWGRGLLGLFRRPRPHRQVRVKHRNEGEHYSVLPASITRACMVERPNRVCPTYTRGANPAGVRHVLEQVKTGAALCWFTAASLLENAEHNDPGYRLGSMEPSMSSSSSEAELSRNKSMSNSSVCPAYDAGEKA